MSNVENIVVYGSGGFAREVVHLIEAINEVERKWNVLGFLSDDETEHGKIINDLPVLGGFEWLENEKDINVTLGIGSPKGKRAVAAKLKRLVNIEFPNLIHPTVKVSKYNTLGKGIIITEGNVLTTNIVLHDFVTLNINSTLGHDVILEKYVTILPNASISGNVTMEEAVDIGTNATVIQGITIGKDTIVGAGAVVVKDLPQYCTAVGMPAKPIKFHEVTSQ